MQHTSMRPQGGDQSLSANGHENDEDLVLFQDMHKSEKAAMQKPVAVPFHQRTPATVAPKVAGEDIFSSSDLEKHDYDWLMTPPVTSFLSSSEHSSVGSGSSLDGSVNVKKTPPAIAKVESPRPNFHSRAKASAQVVRRSSNGHEPAGFSLAHTPTSTMPVSRKLISAATHSPRTSRSSTSVSQLVARSSTPSKSAARIASAGSPTPAGRAASSSNRSVSSVRPSPPIKRPATPACMNNPSSASVKPSSSAVHKTSALPRRSFSSMRPSSPAMRAQMPAIYSVALAGMPQDSPSNLRTSAADRRHSNPRVYPLTKATAVGKGIHSDDVRSRNRHSLSSPIVTRGRVSSGSLSGEDKTLRRNGKPPDAARGVGNKAVDKSMQPRKTLPLSQEKARVVLNTGAKQAGQSTSLAREPSGFGRNLSRKSLDMALRHMDIEGGTPNGFQSFMPNVQTSSFHSVKSKNSRGLPSGRGNLTSSIASSPRGTSSYASSEHSMSIVIDPESSGLGHEMSNEIGRATPASHVEPSMVTSSERKVSCWLSSPVYMDEDNADVMQIFEQELASLSGTDSPLVSQPDGNIDFDDFILEPI